MALSSSLLYIILALLVGIYTGLNLSGFYHDHHHGHHGAQNEPDVDGSQRTSDELRKAQVELKRWQGEAETLQKVHAAAMNKVHKLEVSLEDCPNKHSEEEEDPGKRVDEALPPPKNPNSHPMCQQLSYPTPSALALWNQNIRSIHEATRMPNDRKDQFHDFTAELLQIMTPRLPRSVKSVPHEWESLERAMTVAWERYQYLQLSRKQRAGVTPPRPLKILVMGGSLLVGTNCRKLMTELNFQFQMPKRECNWSNRLGEFLNAYFGDSYFGLDMVQVTKVAMGGTNTATGNVIWQYDLIPEEARNPDIVINAYATNDMHILTILEAQSANMTIRDKVFEMTQDFVRHVMYKSCESKPPPLLLHVDDYLGNEQRKIWETTELSQGVQVLANYYGFTSFSYADVVRDIVYGDTYESWFSANWWDTGNFERDIHPGMGMHIASTWVAVYNLLNLVSTYCSLPSTPRTYNIAQYEGGFLGLPNLKKVEKEAKGKPQPHPKGLPPVLTKDLLIEDVTRLWRQSEKDAIKCDDSNGEGDTKHHLAKCPFSWVSGLSLQQNNETWIKEYFRNTASRWEGWELGNDGGKIGFSPTRNNASDIVLDFSFHQTIRSVTLFFMKSYGAKWKGSRLHIQAWKSPSNIALDERYVVGVHDKNTSEMYTEAIEFSEPILPGTGLRLGVKLVGGTTFKLMGLAVCS